MSTAYPDPSVPGPLDRPTAVAFLERADELLDGGDFDEALRYYRRVVGHQDADVTAAALLGIGTACYRADDEDGAVSAWRAVLQLPETDGTYLAYRQLAAAYVREGRLQDAIEAYRQADRRAPAADRAEIAARLGWLTKEAGDTRGAGRYFARSRRSGTGAASPRVTHAIILITTIISTYASFQPWLYELLQLDKAAVANGEWYRLLTVVLLHAPLLQSPLHLIFNMYALSFGGGLVERIYGGRLMLLMYLLTAAAASTASFAFGGEVPSVGASGAVFGMFGILIAAARAHDPVVDREGQAVLRQIGFLVAINLVIGFVIPGIDWLAHVGGLVAGLWLGVLFVPRKVAARRRASPVGPEGDALGGFGGRGFLEVLAILGVAAIVVAGLAFGTATRL